MQLSVREFQMMEYLMRHPHQVLSREQIEQALWEWGTEPESNAVTTLVRRLGSAFRQLELKIGWKQSTVWVTA